MNKLILFFDLFRKGASVSDPIIWKNRTSLTLALTALILTGCKVAKGFGYDLPISETEAASIAAGVAVIVGLFSTYATSDKVGLLPAKPVHPKVQPISGSDTVRTDIEPSTANNAVDKHERDYPRDRGGGG